MLTSILAYLVLPPEITSFERRYLARINRIALAVVAAHVLFIPAVAAACGTSVLRAVLYTAFVAAGPFLAARTFPNPRHVARVVAFTAMTLCGLLIHFGQGPMQIEMHFSIFVFIALLAVYGDPLVIIVATATVAAHHGLVYTLFPRSVFNYEASAWTVLVHAAFVVVESIAAVFVARSFFDSVIGLEKIVGQRTSELAAKNVEMALVLGNLEQGFLVVDSAGQMARSRSKILGDWLGESEESERFWDYLGRIDAQVAAWLEVGWTEVFDGFLPLELSIDQLPKLVLAGKRALSLSYRRIEDAAPKMLVILSDVTAERERARVEAEQAELQVGCSLLLKDRATFRDFLQEGDELVAAITSASDPRAPDARRFLHTLKGNTAAFGLARVSEQCHVLEGLLDAREESPLDSERAELAAGWARLSTTFRGILGDRASHRVEVERSEHQAAMDMLRAGAPSSAVLEVVGTWVHASAARRLEQLAEHGHAVAARLGKGPIEITVDAGSVRFDAERLHDVSGALVHVLRNAIDHGIESPGERQRRGKDEAGHITLRARRTGGASGNLCVEIEDDGGGIDWVKLEERSRARGLPWATAADREEALFADGVSSRDEATAFSGRGVGLAALRAAVRAIGGRIDVASDPGRGTRVTVTIPACVRSAEAAPPSGVVVAAKAVSAA